MSEWETPKSQSDSLVSVMLGGKTAAQNYEYWAAKWAKGAGVLETEKRPEERTPYARYGPRHAGFWPRDWGHSIIDAPKPAQRDVAAELDLHLTRVAMPPRLADVLRVGPRETPAVAKVREWMAGPGGFLLLHGDVGGGKSVAAASAFLHAKRASWVDGAPEWNSLGAFIDAADIARDLFSESGKELIGYLEHADTVVIDELGAEPASGPWNAALDALINKRFGNPKLRTVLATNVSARPAAVGSPSAFEQRYGSRIARRIRESGTVFHVTSQPVKEAAL